MPNPAPTPTREPDARSAWAGLDPEQRRSRIVQTAIGLLHERGPEHVTVRRVAARLGLGAMTLYTYFDGQRELRRAMVRRGFDMLCEHCEAHPETPGESHWRRAARSYLRFAAEYPNLYKLMFDVPLAGDDLDVLRGGYQPLLDEVTEQFAQQGVPESERSDRAGRAAARFWIGLHGLAMLHISGRQGVLFADLPEVLDDLLPYIEPR